MKNTILLLLIIAFASGCAVTVHEQVPQNQNQQSVNDDTTTYTGEEHPYEDKRRAYEHEAMQKGALRDSYEKGVRDTLKDFKGRMRAKSNFTYEPPVIDVIDMPAVVKNGALYPRHRVPVIIKQGHWVENNGVALPVEK